MVGLSELNVTRPSLNVVSVGGSGKPAPTKQNTQPETVNAPAFPEIQDTSNNKAEVVATQKPILENPRKQRAIAQLAVTAGFGSAAYLLRDNRLAFWLFLISAVFAGTTVVAGYQRKDGSVRPSAISAFGLKLPSLMGGSGRAEG